MSDIAPLPSTTPVGATTTGPNGTPGGTSDDRRLISSDFETFLRMLTTQVENQDPLNPMDSTEFAVQLATFSSVEQQVKTNELLGDMAASGLAQVAGWVGMEARAAVPAQFDGVPLTLQADPARNAERAELVVRDGDGKVWDRFDIGLEGGPVEWTGRRADGSAFAPGSYAFEVVSYGPDGKVLDRSVPEVYGRVQEVRLGADGPEVVFAGGGVARSSEVTGIRAP